MPKIIIQMLVKFQRNGHVCPGFLFIKASCTVPFRLFARHVERPLQFSFILNYLKESNLTSCIQCNMFVDVSWYHMYIELLMLDVLMLIFNHDDQNKTYMLVEADLQLIPFSWVVIIGTLVL